MNDWTPERIAAAREAMAVWSAQFGSPSAPMADQAHAYLDAVALFRIGLTVVEASPETVERVFSVLAWGSPERPPELAGDDQMARAMAGNPALVAKVRAVLAALSGK